MGYFVINTLFQRPLICQTYLLDPAGQGVQEALVVQQRRFLGKKGKDASIMPIRDSRS